MCNSPSKSGRCLPHTEMCLSSQLSKLTATELSGNRNDAGIVIEELQSLVVIIQKRIFIDLYLKRWESKENRVT